MPISVRSVQIPSAVLLALTLVALASAANASNHSARKPSSKVGHAVRKPVPKMGGVTQKPVPILGLVAYWPGDGNGRDVVGRHDAIPSPGMSYEPGKAGKCFALDGKSAYAGVPFAPAFDIDPAGHFTISAWVRPDTVGSYQAVFVKAATKGAWDYGVIIDRGGHFYSGRDANDVAQSKTVVVPGVWYHVAVTYDNGNFQTYVNGVLEAEAANVQIGKSTSGLCIGHKGEISVAGEDPDWLQGDVDEVRFYNRALSADAVKLLYRADK